MVLQGHSDQQRHAGLGRRPKGMCQRLTTDLLNKAEFGWCEENQSCSGGYPELIFAVWSWWEWAKGPVVGLQPTTNLLNHAEFGCSEENQSCSGGYPELIYAVRSWCDWAEGPQWWAGGPQGWAKGPPNPPGGARMKGP